MIPQEQNDRLLELAGYVDQYDPIDDSEAGVALRGQVLRPRPQITTDELFDLYAQHCGNCVVLWHWNGEWSAHDARVKFPTVRAALAAAILAAVDGAK